MVAFIVAVAASRAFATDFVDATRDRDTTFLMTSNGEVYAAHEGAPLHKVFVLRDAEGRIHHWSRAPKSFVHWKSQWVVADGSDVLHRFREDGTFLSTVRVPIRVPRLAATSGELWAVNMMAGGPADQVWHSADGATFTRYEGEKRTAPFDSPASNLLLLRGSARGDVYLSSIIGPPVVHRLWPLSRRADIPVAYSRSRHRASLEDLAGLIDDVTPYSLPVRDLFPLGDGGMVVLRNREDVAGAAGKIETLAGRRLDRYDARGRQIATAVVPLQVHWIIAATPQSVTAISNSGEIAVAHWGKAIPGGILPQ